MRLHPLIRHPVGKMPAAARWYLAGIAVLTLLLIAIHFAIQVYAQQEARRLVGVWSENTGISVGDVRYRMLRGALTLIDFRLNRDDFQLFAPNISLHGNLSSLAGSDPEVTRIEMRGMHASLSLASFSNGRDIPVLFGQLWKSAQRVEVYDSRIDLLPDVNAVAPSQPVGLKLARLQSKSTLGKRAFEALIYGLDGEVRLTANELAGKVAWSGMNADLLLEKGLGLTPMQGQLDGSISWLSKPATAGHYSLSGEARFKEGDTVSFPSSSTISWHGALEENVWHGKLNGTAWPVAMFANHAPQFQGRKLLSGSFSGAINFSGHLKQWQMGVVETHLDDIRYGLDSAEDGSVPEWLVEKMHIAKAAVQWPERRIDIKAAELINADLGFDVRESKLIEPLWSIKTGEIGLSRIRPVLYLSQGELRLPDMKGSFAVKENRRMKLALKSVASNDMGNEERWRVSGGGAWTASNRSRMAINVIAEDATLVRFRSLLPAKIRKSASDITGSVDLKLNLLAGSAFWEGSGEASISMAGLTYKGEQWQAKKVLIGIERIGAGVPKQLIRRLDVQHWRYQAALQPLGYTGESPEVVRLEDGEAERWQINNTVLQNGEVVVGHKDAVWMDQVAIEINNLAPGNRAPIIVDGRLGEGSLSLKGELLWARAFPEIHSAKIVVRDALPFFMNEWSRVSGAPGLIRGRIYTDASLKRTADGRYQGMWYFRLQNGALDSTAVQSDPLLEKTGFNTFDIFSALQKDGRLRLRVSVDDAGPFSEALGSAFVKTLNSEMAQKGRVDHEVYKPGSLLSSVRLHERGTLSQNERVRLRKVISHLRENPKQSIELIPQLGINSSEERQIERSRYTQNLIEKFMNRRGITASRIFPVWPEEAHRSSESVGGIRIHTLQ